MRRDDLATVARTALKAHVRQALRRYWSIDSAWLERVAVAERDFPTAVGALKLVMVPLPEWAVELGVDGCLAVPTEACRNATQPRWAEIDWWLAAFLLLEAWHERAWEAAHGSIHSYSFRLAGWDHRAWDRAWVNRIALFLRTWAAREAGRDAAELLGPLCAAEFVMTHDVDAVEKTWSIRLKQSAFLAFNAARLAARGQGRWAGATFAQSLRFLLGRSDWWMLDEVLAIEVRAGLRSRFNFYADDRPKSLSRWIFDPGYDIAEGRLRGVLDRIAKAGSKVGLHLSYDAWQSTSLMRRQRERLQSFVAAPVTSCRQHWLRFSWRDTWTAQAAAGLEQDTTLMFNDRPGLRAAAALSWKPWNPLRGQAHDTSVLPTLLMDSHFYDYRPMGAPQRRTAMAHWLDEVNAVGGEVALLWHPHTLTRDYGWMDGFLDLIVQLNGRQACAAS